MATDAWSASGEKTSVSNTATDKPSSEQHDLRALIRDTQRKPPTRMTKTMRTIAILLVLGVVGWLIATFGGTHEPPIETLLPRASSTTTPATMHGAAGPVATSQVASNVETNTSTSLPTALVINVAGAVKQPGLYRMPTDARVGDALSRAGGATADADLDRINLAQKLSDEAHVYVAKKGQPTPELLQIASTCSGATSGAMAGASGTISTNTPRININTADAKKLEDLPGVGPATAQAIIARRTTHGPFKNVDELAQVKGIGSAKLEQIKTQATVS